MNPNRIKASILIPCRNEADSIENCIRNVFSFDPPDGGFEVIVIDGQSDDGTKEILSGLKDRYQGLTVLDNPARTTPHAMNIGIRQARGEFIIRTDVRCVHPKSYLKDLIELSERTKADNVGGVLIPSGTTYSQRAIAAAYRSRLAMGGALRDRGNFEGETDAVYGGCFRKKRLVDVGMYDEEMIRNQDDELSFRLRSFGGKIMQSGKIKVRYFPRKKFRQLWKQFLQYGYWKVSVLSKHPKQSSVRHLFPGMLVAGFALLTAFSFLSVYAGYGLALYTGGYLSAIGAESYRIARRDGMRLMPGVMLAIASIHTGFGTGFLIALFSKLFALKPAYFETLSR